MTIEEAKNSVRNLVGKKFQECIMIENIDETIRMVSEASINDKEAQDLLNYIPNELQYLGLYPTIMKSFDAIPDYIKK